jgi:glyoxylase-like metal-dependent hydrolase (beta-lactamase superfamily II)
MLVERIWTGNAYRNYNYLIACPEAGDVIKVGKTVELECLDTPGHTMCHICLFAHTEQPVQEHAHNTFFRLDNASIIAGLHAAVPELPAKPDAETVFRTLRELRNKW